MRMSADLDRTAVAILAAHSWTPRAAGVPLRSMSHSTGVNAGRVLAVWPEEDASALRYSPVLLMPDTDVREFLAWMSTYGGLETPVTGQVRVMGPEEFFGWESESTTHSEVLESAILAWAAAAVCEADFHAQSRSTSHPPSRGAIESTLARALAATIVRTDPDGRLAARVERAWRDVTGLGADAGAYGSSAELSFFSVIQSFFRDHGRLLRDSEIPSTDGPAFALMELFGVYADRRFPRELRDVLHELDAGSRRGARERQVMAFDRFVQLIRLSPVARDTIDVLIGYAASAVAPGSLQHSRLVLSESGAGVLASWAFGVFSYLRDPTSVIAFQGNLPLRIARGCLRQVSVFDPVVADLAISEYRMLREVLGSSVQFPTQSGGRLIVELAPGIELPTRAQPAGPAHRESEAPVDASESALRRIRDRVSELVRVLDEVDPQHSREQPDSGLWSKAWLKDVDPSTRRKRRPR